MRRSQHLRFLSMVRSFKKLSKILIKSLLSAQWTFSQPKKENYPRPCCNLTLTYLSLYRHVNCGLLSILNHFFILFQMNDSNILFFINKVEIKPVIRIVLYLIFFIFLNKYFQLNFNFRGFSRFIWKIFFQILSKQIKMAWRCHGNTNLELVQNMYKAQLIKSDEVCLIHKTFRS